MGADANALVGRTLAKKYRLVRSIGAGGMGIVFEAVHVELHRRVALKVLLENDPRSLARFGQEALATSKLDSPHIVRIIDFDPQDGLQPFIVMELLDGESLRDAMRRVRPVPLRIAVKVAVQLLEALASAHGAGIVHRDVKPANVFLERSTNGETNVKLLDFGIAKLAPEAGGMKTTAGTIVGTPAYLAPEQIMGDAVDGRTDLYAVGLLLYEMLLGKRPWDGRHGAELGIAIVEERVRPIVQDDVPAEVAAIISCALEKNPAARFADANAMRQGLLAFLRTDGATGTSTEDRRLASREQPVRAADVPDGVRDPAPTTTAPRRATDWVAAVCIVALLVSTAAVMRDEPEAKDAPAGVTSRSPQVETAPPPNGAGAPALTSVDAGTAPSGPAPTSPRPAPSHRVVTPPPPPIVTPNATPSARASANPPNVDPSPCGGNWRDPFTGKCDRPF